MLNRLKHRDAGTKLHLCWASMKNRCYNKNNDAYYAYGARGIKVCEEWKNSYIAFKTWAMINGYKQGLQLDRIDNNGNYEPSNCRWATRIEQQNNTRANHNYTINGVTKSISAWAREYSINHRTLRSRLRSGMSIESALTTKLYCSDFY